MHENVLDILLLNTNKMLEHKWSNVISFTNVWEQWEGYKMATNNGY